MLNKLRYLLILSALLPVMLYAQTGKIAGKVTDLQTGEPLISANVIVVGTNLGAATNENGEFIILNVPPGTYTLTGRYIGYREATLQNMRVSVNLTTEANFHLPSDSYQTQTVTITAPKPLINKNSTNATSVVKAEDIENLPIRGVNAVVATQAGVVTQSGNIYVRGSRADAVAYYVDGVLVNNPVFGGAQTSVISNAVEEIQFQAGGYPAEFGGANGGIISTQTRTGSEKLKFTLEAITDNFMPVGHKYLGGYSYGYSEFAFTAGGPVLPNSNALKFFLAGNNTFTRTPVAWLNEIKFDNLYDPGLAASAKLAGKPVSYYNLYFPEGYYPNNAQNTFNVQGNFTYDMNPFTFRLNGTYRYTEGRNGVGFAQYTGRNRAGMNQGQTLTSSLKITHVFNASGFYDIVLNMFDDYYVDMDPVFKHNIALYGDSLANAALGYPMRADGQGLTAFSAYGFSLRKDNVPYNAYRKQRTGQYGGKANFLYQAGSHHELKFGGDYTYYIIRRYSLPAPVSLASNVRSVADGPLTQIYTRLDNYGYDIFGNKVEDGQDGPKHPKFAAFYVQDKIEYPDLVINAGLRLDYIDIDGEVFKNPQDIQFTKDNMVDPNGLVRVDPVLQVSPRLGFSFPVTDRTVFFAQYGKFIQQTRLRDVYLGYNLISDQIHGGYAEGNPVGFGLKPERTTQYELGFKQQFGELFAFSVSGFYKDIKDQIQMRQIYGLPNTSTPAYYAYVNGDFATTKGFEFKLDLRRTERVSATVNYTYSDAQGTGSNSGSAFYMIWQTPTATPYTPQSIAPLDFNQAHRGYVNVDYRFDGDDGPEFLGAKILENFGLNMLFSFNSGFNFTRWVGFNNTRVPIEPLNSSTTPWTYQLDARLDKSFNFGGLGFNVYVWITNVLNTKNVVGVFNVTGDAYDNGYLNSAEGKATIEGYRRYGENIAQTYQDLYKALNYAAGNFGNPRQIRVGIKLNY